jgi:hypothetical protein
VAYRPEHAASRKQDDTLEKHKRTRELATFGALVATAVAAILTLTVTHCDTRLAVKPLLLIKRSFEPRLTTSE